MVLGIMFGIANAPYNVSLSIILGALLPVEKVASAFGILSLVQGVGCILGPVMGGFIYDTTKDDKLILFLAAIGWFIGAFSTCMSYIYVRKVTRRTPT